LDIPGGSSVVISGATIEFDFIDGADPNVFATDGLFNIGTFFGAGFLSTYGNIFSSDTFEGVNFDPANGDLTPGASSTPEPGTLFLLLPVLGILGMVVHRRKSLASTIKWC
jgi:hypothetical protein